MKRVLAVLLLWPMATAAAQQLPRLEPITRIGCADCEGPTSFAGIMSVALHDDRVYVLDNSAPHVRVFGTDGRLIRSFSRKGQGPGELQLPILVSPRARGELEVYDLNQRRFTRFDSTGTVLGTRQIRGFTVLAVSAPLDTQVVLVQSDFRSTDQPMLRLADGSSEPSPLAMLTAAFPKVAPGELARTPALVAHPHGGVAVGDGIAEYRIRRFDAEGRVLGDIVRAIPRPRKSQAELAAEQERMERRRARMSQMMRAEGASAPRGAFTPRPEHNHFDIGALAYDDSGRLWVRTHRGGLEGTLFDLFGADGAFLGELRVPMRVGPFVVRGGVMAGVVTDDDEVPYVQVWKVR